MIVWAHGLEGSPDGVKVQALRNAGFTVVSPDCRGMLLADRLDILGQVTLEHAAAQPILAGSSYGGLAVAWLAAQHPDRFSALLLCAPALHHSEPPLSADQPVVPPAGMRVRIVHGTDDQVVPISASRTYAVGPLVRLDEVRDGHRLVRSLDKIVGLARELAG